MNTKNCSTHRGDEVVMLLPLLALFGALVGIGYRMKRRHRHQEHREHGDGEHAHCVHGNGHGCRGCHGGHFDHDQRRGHEQGSKRRGFDPMRILDKRFAGGEIDEDEYLRRRTVLKENA